MSSRVLAAALLAFLQGVRERLFLGSALFFLFYLSACTVLGVLSPGESDRVMRHAGLLGIELCGLVMVITSLVFSFYRERDTHMLAVYLVHCSRLEYILGKFAGYALLSLVFCLLCGAGYGLALMLFGYFTPVIFAGVWAVLLKMLIYISFSLVLCCLFSSPALTLLCSFFVFVSSEAAFGALSIIAREQQAASRALVQTIYYLLPNMHQLDLRSFVAYGRMPPAGLLAALSVYAFVYIFFLWLIIARLFVRKQQ